MLNWNELIKEMMTRGGFEDWSVEVDDEHHHAVLFLRDNPVFIKENLPALVESFNHISQLIARKHGETPIFFDINNYRKERENLITELAKAAARKVTATNEAMSLPAMNSYERRIVHLALATHPFVRTESSGTGKNRYVVIRLVGEAEVGAGSRGETSPDAHTLSAE